MFKQATDETSEMQHMRLQIEREDRTIKENTERLAFKLKEYTDKRKQVDIRNDGVKKDYKLRQLKLLNDKLKEHHGNIERAKSEIGRSQQDILKLQRELQNTEENLRRKFNNGKGAQADRELREAINRSPEIIRINHHIRDTQRAIEDQQNKVRDLTQALEREERQLRRTQELDFDKLVKDQQRDINALEDSWMREKSYFEGKIKAATGIRDRLVSDYQSQERDYKIKLAQQKKAESEKRARFGDDKGKKNFAEANDENPLRDPEKNRFSNPRGRY